MAFPCKIWLKAECDGCGLCDEQRHGYSAGRDPFSEEDDPFEIDYRDEE